MGEIVNLKQARKNKARAEKERAAEGNRRKFGASQAVREKLKAERELDARKLDAHRREDDEDS